MYLKCSHPECSSDFDYTQGRLYRFQQTPKDEKQPKHWHSVKHYWLCSRCCETFTIEYQNGIGVLLMQRLEALSTGLPSHYVLQAEAPAKLPPARRHIRHAIRERNRQSDQAPGKSVTIEILENRNLERRG